MNKRITMAPNQQQFLATPPSEKAGLNLHPQERNNFPQARDVMTLHRIYEQALKNFPYPNLTATGGFSIFEFPDPTLILSLQYDFDAEKLVEELGSRGKLSPEDTVDGWVMIDFYSDNGEIRIEAVGDIARNNDWDEGRVLSERDMIFGYYDVQKREWDFWVAH